jgi:hypothetical protein
LYGACCLMGNARHDDGDHASSLLLPLVAIVPMRRN